MPIQEFISYISSVRRYSARTCEIYSEALERFKAWYETEYGTSASVADSLSPSVIRSFEVFLMEEEKLDPRTVDNQLSVLSSFCKYLIKQGALESNPVRLVTRPKTAKRLPVFYRGNSMNEYFEETEHLADEEALDELQALVAHDPADKTAVELYRSRLRRLIVCMLYTTGMRRSELLSLTRASLDMDRRVLKVRGKGDKMREIPLVHSLCNEILLYLQSVDTMIGVEDRPDTPLLMTEKGAPLYPVYVDRAVKTELGEVGSITGRKSPHVLRHTLATELLNEGTDINSIKELLGHSSLAATQVYTHNSIEKLKKVYNNAHPRAKNGGNYGD